MKPTKEDWNAYRTLRAMLTRGQQEVILACEEVLSYDETGACRAIGFSNELVNKFRRGCYSVEENLAFLAELGGMKIYSLSNTSINRPFEFVEYTGQEFRITLSRFFAVTIGSCVRKSRGEWEEYEWLV